MAFKNFVFCVFLGTTALAADPLRVAVYVDLGTGGPGVYAWAHIAETSPEMKLTLVDGKSIRDGVLEQQDLLVMPGGSGTGEFNQIGPRGVENVRAFIQNGGSYLGTCAGAFLTLPHRMNIVPYRSRGWEPQTAFVSIDVNEKGAAALGVKTGRHILRYHGGPFLIPDTNTIEGASFDVWGSYMSDWARKSKAVDEGMYGAGAIVAGTYGKGHVFISACHPEYHPGDYAFITGAIKWMTGRDVTIPARPRKVGARTVALLCAPSAGTARMQLALDLAALPGVDFSVLSKELIHQGALDHTDVLVLADAHEKTYRELSQIPTQMKLIRAFAARGGKSFATGSGKLCLPEGGVFCTSNADLLAQVKSWVEHE